MYHSIRNFAENVGLTFHTPEEFFLQEEPRPFIRSFEPSEYVTDLEIAEGLYIACFQVGQHCQLIDLQSLLHITSLIAKILSYFVEVLEPGSQHSFGSS